MSHLEEVKNRIFEIEGVRLCCVVDEDFYLVLKELREFSGRQTAELKCPLMRLLQIEELLGRHVRKQSVAIAVNDVRAIEEILSGPASGENERD